MRANISRIWHNCYRNSKLSNKFNITQFLPNRFFSAFSSSAKMVSTTLLSGKLGVMDVPGEEFSDKKVLMRVDFNVPLGKSDDGKKVIKDETRIKAAVPTIQHILKQNPKCLTLMSHLGRPDGQRNTEKFSLEPVAECLEKLLGEKVNFVDECLEGAGKIEGNKVNLLENLRFHVEEEGKGVRIM
jgi:phosphoglycerate kinase